MCWALSSQRLLCRVLVESGMVRRTPDVPEPRLGAGLKLLWPFLFSLEPCRPANPSLAPVCREGAGPGICHMPLLASRPQCSAEPRCGAVCGQRRTQGSFTWTRVPVSLLSQRLMGSSISPGGTMAQQVPVQAIQVHQAPQQTSPSSDSSTDLTQTSSSGTGNWDIMEPCL